MMRSNCLYTLLLSSVYATAQVPDDSLHKFVVADMETRVPIRDAIVVTGSGYRDTTNYRGICYIPTHFDTLSIQRHGYLTERLLSKEIKDSTFLIPNSKRISEVTIWGKQHKTGMMSGMDRAIQEGMANDKSAQGTFNIAFDFAKMLDKRYRKDMKHLEKTREIFQKMDKHDDDPIVNAYKKALEEKRLEDERKKALQERAEKAKQDALRKMEEKKKLTEENEKKQEP